MKTHEPNIDHCSLHVLTLNLDTKRKNCLQNFKFSRFSICFFLIICNIIPLQAQITDGAALPSSAVTSATARNIDIPVDLSTGRATVQIPLCMAGPSNMQIPLTLSYQTSGIKVTDIATWVGLGWDLSAGGKITRVVRGYPDEKGYLVPGMNTSLQFLLDVQKNWDYGIFDSYYDKQSKEYLDGQPDVFYFEIPGKSGMFVFDPAGKPHTIPYQDIDIEWVDKTYFTIQDENGNKFIFGDTDASREKIQQTIIDSTEHIRSIPGNLSLKKRERTLEYISAWNLTQMSDCNGETISVEYDNMSSYEYSNYNEATLVNINASTKEHARRYNYYQHILTKETPAYITKVTWRTGQLRFTSSTNKREDFKTARQLDKIDIYTIHNNLIRSVSLSYGKFSNGSLKLSDLYEESGNQKRKICSFEYNSTIHMPERNLAGYDHWGYYNGTKNERLKAPICDIAGIPFGEVSREPDINYAKASILESIIFRNGGTKRLLYEMNQGIAYSENTASTVGGLRIKQIIDIDPTTSDTKITQYDYVTESGNPSGKQLFYKPLYYDIAYIENENGVSHYWTVVNNLSNNFLFDASGNTTFYTSVKVTMPDSSYSYTKFYDARDENGKKTMVPDGGNISTVYEWDIRGSILNTSYAWKRLPIEITSYTPQGKLISKQTNEYSEDWTHRTEIDAYLLISTGASDPVRGRFLGWYRYISSPYRLVRTKTYSSDYALASETQYKYGKTKNILMPIETITYTVENDTLRNRVKYSSDYFDVLAQYTGNDTMLVALQTMQLKNMNAIPIERIQEKNGKVLNAQLMTFRTLYNDAVVLHKTKNLFLKQPIANSSFQESNMANDRFSFDNRYEDVQIVDQYDEFLNAIQSHDVFGNNNAVIYGYEGTLPIAKIENAQASCTGERTNEVIYTSFEDVDDQFVEQNFSKTGRKVCQGVYKADISDLSPGTYIVSYWIKDNATAPWRFIKETFTVQENLVVFNKPIGTATSYIDELRIYPQDARMVSYTYDPGIGKTSETDINDRSTYTQYDAFGRVIEIRDNDQHKRTSYEYYD